MPFKKGQSGNDKGRTKGTQNKSTEKAKELFITIMSGNVKKFRTALDYLYKKDKIKWLDVVNKFFPYYLPRQTDITSDGESIKPDINISVVNKKIAKDLKKLFDADN